MRVVTPGTGVEDGEGRVEEMAFSKPYTNERTAESYMSPTPARRGRNARKQAEPGLAVMTLPRT